MSGAGQNLLKALRGWLPQPCRHFDVRQLEALPGGFWVIIEPIHRTAD